MRKHDFSVHVANGIDVFYVRAHFFVGYNSPLYHGYADIFDSRIRNVGAAPDGYQNLIGRNISFSVVVRHRNRAVLYFGNFCTK